MRLLAILNLKPMKKIIYTKGGESDELRFELSDEAQKMLDDEMKRLGWTKSEINEPEADLFVTPPNGTA